MKKVISTFFVCFIATRFFGQDAKKISTYLQAQYNKTITDRTLGNNPWSAGLGVQAYYSNKSRFKPTIEITGDAYLENDKVLRTDANDVPLKDVRGMVNIFLGSSYHLTNNVYISVTAGPSFVSGQTLLGIKPSLGFYFNKSQRWGAKVSYINVFNRDKTTNQDFSSLSLGIGLRLF